MKHFAGSVANQQGRASRFLTSRNIAYLAVLLALVIVLQVWASAIPVGGATLNFALLPIVLGAILLGTWAGALLGFACGVVVLVQVIVLTGNPFYLAIWTNSPVITTLTCIVKTTAAGVAAGLLYRLIVKKNKLIAVFVASGIVPIVNTGLFILGCLCMSGTIADFGGELAAGMNILIFIMVYLITLNFFVEFATNLLLAPGIFRVVEVVERQLGRKGGEKRAHLHESEERAQQEAQEIAERMTNGKKSS